MRSTFFVLIALIAHLSAGCATTPGAARTLEPPVPLAQRAELTYKNADDVELKVHVFRPEGQLSDDPRPAIVFFFGGGWNGGTPTQFYSQCQHLASRGMVAMSAEYRVRSRNGTTPAECVEDGKSVMRWVRAHASELGVDPDRLAAGGGSAGGHVAAAVATTRAFNAPTDDVSVSCRPEALVLFNPVFDNGPNGYGHDRVKDYWRDISPLHNLSPKTPPTIVFLGTEDHLIPVEVGEAYRDEMRGHSTRCDLHLYEGASHGFFNESRSPEHYADTVEKMDAFLVSLGFLEATVEE